MATAKSRTSKSSLAKGKKKYFDPIILVAILCIALAGIAFVLYASAATVSSVIK
jgi:hypothetical protein